MSPFPFAAFTISLLAALYFIAGYPLILGYLARRAPRPILKRFVPRSVSVVMAVRNGERWIGDKLDSILQQDYPRELLEVIVVSDGSTDATEQIVQGYAGQGVRLIPVGHGGKAIALNAGIACATGEVFFFNDVRQRLHPEALRNLIACLGDPNVGSACGQTLFLGGEERAHLGLYWRCERWLRLKLSTIDSLLAGTCFYVVRRELVDSLPPGTLLDDSWLPLSGFLRGFRFVLDPEALAWDYPNELQSEFMRKVRTLAGIYQIVMLRPALLSRENRMLFHFISYRLGRVLLPFLLLTVLATSFALPAGWRELVLAAWIACAVLAALDFLVPEGRSIKRATSAMRTFMVFMAASACAVSIFIVPPNVLWRDAWIKTEREPGR